MNIKEHFRNFLIFFLIVLCFTSFKFGIEYSIFIYPYLIYLICKRNSNLVSFKLMFLLGLLIFWILFYFGNKVGLVVTLLGSIICGLTFGISAYLTSYSLKKYKRETIVAIFSFPLFFLISKVIIFDTLVGVKQFLDMPFILGSLFYYLGSTGVNFILMCISISFWYLLFKKKFKFVIVPIVLLISIFSLNYFIINSYNYNYDLAGISIIQGNFEKSVEWRYEYAYSLIYPYYYNKTLEIIENHDSKIIFWPEYAINRDIRKNETLINELINLSNENNITLVFGSYEFENNEFYDVSNVVDNGVIESYRSQIIFTDTDSSQNYKVGDTNKIFVTDNGNFITLICYEALFRKISNSYNMDEIHFIVVMANNQWINDKFAFNVLTWNMRDIAATYRKPVISVTNTGPSMIIDEFGRIVKRGNDFEEDVLTR